MAGRDELAFCTEQSVGLGLRTIHLVQGVGKRLFDDLTLCLVSDKRLKIRQIGTPIENDR